MTRPITGRWYQSEVQKHDQALGRPQRFPLTGDGERTEELLGPRSDPKPAGDGDKWRTARYRDWKKSQRDAGNER
jgi:hypothetical protein